LGLEGAGKATDQKEAYRVLLKGSLWGEPAPEPGKIMRICGKSRNPSEVSLWGRDGKTSLFSSKVTGAGGVRKTGANRKIRSLGELGSKSQKRNSQKGRALF